LKKVLIITYYWPPSGGPGVQRFLKFCKYFHDFNWDPIVLTVKNGNFPNIDISLEKDVSPKLKIIKTKTIEPFLIYNKLIGTPGGSIPITLSGEKDKGILKKLSLFLRANLFIPDARIGWKNFAIHAAKKIISKNDIKTIITTGPPQSTHLIGLSLKKKYKIPWVADFRDPWTNVYYNKYLPRTLKSIKKDKMLENKVLNACDAVTVVSEGLSDEFFNRSKHIEVIHNGYDYKDIYKANNICTSRFSLEYVGNLKSNQNIKELWEAIEELLNDYHEIKNKFTLSFTGNVNSQIIELIKDFKLLNSCLNVNNYVTHEEAIDRMMNTNLLLFIIPKTENNNLIITGKIFEYMATRTPILSVGPKTGEASNILDTIGRDPMIAYDDKETIKKQIKKYFSGWLKLNGKKIFHSKSNLKKFSRKKLTQKYSFLLNEVAK
tara:strand:+ start:34394 stop:35695 length:1302 start_codon:yes stop_codon:yes gene_type:complete